MCDGTVDCPAADDTSDEDCCKSRVCERGIELIAFSIKYNI